MSQLEKVPSKQRGTSKCLQFETKSIRGAVLYVIFSIYKPVLDLFLLLNFQIDSALTFPSGLKHYFMQFS